MSDDFELVVLEYHDHPAGEWCDDEHCQQRVEAHAAIRETEPVTAEILAFGTRTDNAQLMVDCHLLGYLPEPVLDATYGKGRFWRMVQPTMMTNDLDESTDAQTHYDFRSFPHSDRAFATVVFDPPYKYAGTSTGKGAGALNGDYGVNDYMSVADRNALILDGVTECSRVADRFLIVKVQDQVVSGKVHWQTLMVIGHMTGSNFDLTDMLHVRGYRRQPPGRRQVHARRDYSTALVFERRR